LRTGTSEERRKKRERENMQDNERGRERKRSVCKIAEQQV